MHCHLYHAVLSMPSYHATEREALLYNDSIELRKPGNAAPNSIKQP